MTMLRGLLLIVAALVLLPAAALASPVTHELVVVEQTKQLLADLAYYAKYLLPAIAVVYAIWGGIQRSMAGDDEMRKMRADRTLTNAKVGLVIGFVAAPVLYWLQKYYS